MWYKVDNKFLHYKVNLIASKQKSSSQLFCRPKAQSSMLTLTLYSFSVDLKLNIQIQPKNASQEGLWTLKKIRPCHVLRK
jgi:hypothetical protein